MNRENSKSISEVIRQYVKDDHMEDGLLRVRIFNAWEDLIFEMSSPLLTREESDAVTTRKFFSDGVLTCRLSSSLYRTQLRFQLEQIRARLNSRLGDEIVKKIILN